MKIVTLMENESIDSKLKHAHGLSLYIEWKNHKILFDLGPNRHFLTNAKKLKIDLKKVDTVIISHGHYDHGLGLKAFMSFNKKAKIYLSEKAFEKQTKKIGNLFIPIGLRMPKNLDNFVFIKNGLQIDPGFNIYNGVPYKERIIGDSSLYTMHDGVRETDTFEHEIYLGLKDGEHNVLFSGCSHKGIENIMEYIETNTETKFTDVIAGFHLSHYDPNNTDETEYLKVLSDKLTTSKKTNYYSCHCTGNNAYKELDKYMHKQLHRIKTGSVIKF
jgi:7,8-dihydropterin-6-yl-methyl-4-(beta-D-ribofuranosyl)aminobenzene 5'-phosphate synthase